MDDLKLATLEDVNDVVRMAKLFARNSPHKTMKFADEKFKKFVEGVVTGDLSRSIIILAHKEGVPIGMVVAVAMEPVWSNDKVATELAWYVKPKHRGSKQSLRLFRAYEDWALRVGCTHIQNAHLEGSEYRDTGRFYERKGYTKVESSYVKTLKGVS